MIAMDEHVIVLDFKMGGESVASVVSTRDNMLPVPPAGSIVHVGLPQERQTFVTLDAPLVFFFTGQEVVVEVEVEPADEVED